MQADTQAAIEQIISLGSSDERLIKRGEHVTAVVRIAVGGAYWLLHINKGEVTHHEQGPVVMPSYTFGIEASETEWHKFWQPVPPPGSQDLFALLKRRVLKLDGDLHPLMSHLFYFKFLLAAPRKG